MWAALLRVDTPACSWCREAGTRHPDVGLKVLSYYRTPDGRGIETVELTGSTWRDVYDETAARPDVRDAGLLESSPTRGLARFGVPACALPEAIEASGATPKFPFVVSGACDSWLVVSERDRVQRFHENLKQAGVEVSVVHSGEYEPERKLTPRRREILEEAVRAGYYDFPRRITLTRLAERLGMSKSALSEAMMHVEKEIVASFMRGD